MKQGEVILSEVKVFWEVFCELAFETLYRKALPLEMLNMEGGRKAVIYGV